MTDFVDMRHAVETLDNVITYIETHATFDGVERVLESLGIARALLEAEYHREREQWWKH